MTQVLIATAVKVLLGVGLLGLAHRGRLSWCWSLPSYMAAVLVCTTLSAVWPERFFTPQFWILRQALFDILKLLIALELAWRVLRAFPGALRLAKASSALLLFASSAWLLLTPWGGYFALATWQPRAVAVVSGLFALTAVLVEIFYLPVRSFYRTLLLGFSVYQVVFGLSFELLKRAGWGAAGSWGIIEGFAYLGLVVTIAWTAWTPERALDGVSPSTLRRFRLEGSMTA